MDLLFIQKTDGFLVIWKFMRQEICLDDANQNQYIKDIQG